MREHNFDGLVGPTHNFGGLSPGNTASTSHGGQLSSPRTAALQGLAKMRFVRGLGVGQAVLPPQPRPSLRTLRALGITGSDEDVLARAARDHDHLLRLCSSASSMWAANAATVAPSSDTADGKLHLTPANLQAMFHRVIEAPTTTRVLRAIFADPRRFVVHDPLPGGGQFADEGAANHTRLVVGGRPAVHLHGWGRRAWTEPGRPGPAVPTRFPARQTREACEALARHYRLEPTQCVIVQQHPEGIDGGAFHTDVLAVGTGSLLLVHELAFVGLTELIARLYELCGDELVIEIATEDELPLGDAVSAYPFNSQLLELPDGKRVIVAPEDSRENPRAKAFLDRVVEGEGDVRAVHYLDVRESMHNGGGPACLRLRVAMTDAEHAALGGRVTFDAALDQALVAWVEKHYRDRLLPRDLADPALHREVMTALDELTRILELGTVYDFQDA